MRCNFQLRPCPRSLKKLFHPSNKLLHNIKRKNVIIKIKIVTVMILKLCILKKKKIATNIIEMQVLWKYFSDFSEFLIIIIEGDSIINCCTFCIRVSELNTSSLVL